MNRRHFIRQSALLTAGYNTIFKESELLMKLFDFSGKKIRKKKFAWGAATSAYQTEGAVDIDGKAPSIWDVFTHKKGKVKNGENGDTAVDFYRNYKNDIGLLGDMNLNAFRFSLSWPRIMPRGEGAANTKGIDFYHRVIDHCLKKDIEPWVTLYHWDLPQALEEKGGWTNRDIVERFTEYADVCTRAFGNKVKNWIVLNEPMTFTGLGYYTGYHAPGRKGLNNFLPAAHHAALCQAEGGRIVRSNVKKAETGTSFSFSHIKPVNKSDLHIKAAQRIDAIVNRLFIEPSLGLGYPFDTLPALKRIEKYFKPGDDEKLKFNFDFYGVQYYFRLVSRFSLIPPLIFAREVPAEKRDAVVNAMGFEVYPKGLYKVLKKVGSYKGVKKIVVTECGVCYEDQLENGRVHDPGRTGYLKETIGYTLKAIENGVHVKGYFVWSLTDNFEWSEGYSPRFGLVYTDYPSLDRYIKDSGLWLRDFLKEK